MQLTIPTTDEIRDVVRDELAAFFSNFQFQSQTPEVEDIGKGAEFASKIIGKAVPTVYDLVNKRLLPHSKRGGDLYFSRRELLQWLKDGKRKTQTEIALEAANHSPEKPRQSKTA